jgi:hypoxanthine-DNA glycosylase
MLLSHGVALWDVIASCDIVASSDASITNVLPNDISQILRAAPIQAVYCNGGKAFSLYRKHLQPTVGRPAEKLPSTSPANASWTETRLIGAWRKALGKHLTAE